MNMRRLWLLHQCVATALIVGAQTGSPQSKKAVPIPSISALREQAVSGDAKAQFRLGMDYASGQGVPQDYDEAAYWWRKSAAQGNVNAESSLGWFYFIAFYPMV